MARAITADGVAYALAINAATSAADVGWIAEDGAEMQALREIVELGPSIGNRDEVRARVVSGEAGDLLMEVAEMRERLDGAARLGGDDEQRMLQINLLHNIQNGGRVG